jgi:dynein intermediate chain, cytosolic
LSLVTASTDGRLNFWSITNLRDPAESIQVGDSISCFTIVPDTETIVVGDEHGTMYTVMAPNTTNTATTSTSATTATTSRSSSPVPPSVNASNTGQRVSRRQVKKFDIVDDENLGHYGMITSISAKRHTNVKNTTYPSSNNNNQSQQHQHHHAGISKGYVRGCGGLLVSSGVDWTIKIWAPAYHERPILSWLSHSYDYMSDVAWSTTHPSLFATASSNGTIGLWNLASSFDEPITGPDGIPIVDTELASGIGLNKLKWSTDGRRIAVASSDRVYMLNISDDIIRMKGDEEMKVMNQLLSRGLL